MKFVSVNMVRERNPGGLQFFTREVEDRDRQPRSLFGKWALMCDPGAHHVLNSEGLRIADHRLKVVAQRIERRAHAPGPQSGLRQLSAELLRRETVCSPHLNIAKSQLTNFGQCAGNVLCEFGAQAVKLQAERACERWADARASIRAILPALPGGLRLNTIIKIGSPNKCEG